MRTLVPLLLTVTLATRIAAQVAGAVSGDDAVLTQLEAARKVAAAAGDAIWPGFDLRMIPIAIYRSGGEALAIHVRAAPPGFERLETERVTTPVFRGKATEAMTANTSGRLGEDVAAFIQRSSLSPQGVAASDLSLLFHEAGHAFHARAPAGGPGRWPVEDATRVADYPIGDADNNAWGRIEGRLLRAALLAADDGDARERARDFLAARKLRRRGLGADVAMYEQRLELNEGLAEYFGIRAVLVAPRELAADVGPEGACFADFLARLGSVNLGGRGAARSRFYLTGAAQGLLLDRFSPAWKPQVEAPGKTLEELLVAAVAFDRASADARAAQVAASERFDALFSAEVLAARALYASMRGRLLAILAAPGRKLVLDLSHAGGAGRLTSFDPMNIVATDTVVKVHERMLALDFSGGSASFEVPVVQDTGREWLIAVLPDGAAVDRERGITAPGLQVRWDRAEILETDALLIAAPHAPPGSPPDPAPVLELVASATAESQQPVPAEPFEVTDLAGQVHAQPELTARETTLVFVSAAPWAAPAQRFARELLDALGQKPRETAERRWLLVGSQCSAGELVALLGPDAARANIVHDADRWLAQLFDVSDYPTVVKIGADGHIAGRWVGATDATSAAALEGFN